MPLQASFIWKNADSTKDLNARLERIVERGVVWGGLINPNATSLNLEIDPLVAVSFDGMTVANADPHTVLVAANTNNYIVIRARYNENGSPATPTLYYQVLPEASYNIDPEKDYLIVLGRVELPPAATTVSASDIYYDVKDEVTPQGRDWFRGTVAIPGDLPVPPPYMNKEGDFYFVQSANTFYFWNSTSWEPLNTGSFNSETTIMNKGVVDAEWKRIVEGSGVVAGVRPEQGNFASGTEITLEETSGTPDQIGLDTFSAIVNGHYVQTHGQYVPLDAPPGVGQRYDLIFLEVWREELVPPAASPETVDYEKNPDGTTTYTIQQVDDKLESLTWDAGIPAVSGDNFSLHKIDAYDHGWRVLKYRFSRISGTTTTALYNPSHPSISSAATNIDGNAFTSQPAGSGMDDRIWVAPAAATSADGYSWAIPILVLKRDSAETYVHIFTDGVRTALPVYPVADLAHAGRQAIDNVHTSSALAPGLDQYPYDEPSGFLSGMGHTFSTAGAAQTITLYQDQVKVRVRGVEDWIRLPGGPDLSIDAPPAAGYARTLVYLKMNYTLYDNAVTGGAAVDGSLVSQKHHPYTPSSISGTVRSQGWKRGFITWQFAYQTWANTDYRDEDDAMLAAGWTRGDVTMAAANAQYEDGGIWSRSIAIDADDRIHPLGAEWAIPVCIIHRRNTSAWAYNNQNGTGVSRPDSRQDADFLHPDDLVDLRHEVGLGEEEIKARLEADVNRSMVGALHTRMANKYLGSGTGGEVAGSRILQTDFIGNVPGEYNMDAGDSRRRIWSDAREFHVEAARFDLLSSSSGANYTYTYDAANNAGELVIRAPAYAHLVRHIPAIVVSEGTSPTSTTWMEFDGAPLWTSQWEYPPYGPSARPAPAAAKWIDTSVSPSSLENLDFYWAADTTPPYTVAPGYQGMTVTARDALGNATEMSGLIDTTSVTSGEAALSWWIHYDRSFVAPYDVNFGLAEIPDVVHAVTKDPLGAPEQMSVGPLYCIVKKTLTTAATATITDADVTAASGLTGAVTLCGLGEQIFETPAVVSSTTMTTARDEIEVTFGAAYTGEYQVVVYFYTADVDKWVEIGRGGKSIQAYFKYNESTINFGSQPAPAGYRNISLGPDVFVNAEGPFSGKITHTGWVWAKTLAATEWTLTSTNFSGSEYTNYLTFAQTGLDQEALVIAPVSTALTSAATDTIQIDYTYTPYQGLSGTGGEAATITPTLVQGMKDKLHGMVVDNTDFVVTQSGAASYFSGVDCFGGVPFNHHYRTFDVAVAAAQRFEHYNRTGLVIDEATTRGVQDLRGVSGWRQNCPAAAVLRLPFPQTFSMVDANYHVGVMDFDLDPARAGSAAGEFTFAPSYPNGPTPFNNARLDQFVNGLAFLRPPSDGRHVSKKLSMLSSSWVPTSIHTAGEPSQSTGRYVANSLGEIVSLLGDIKQGTDHLVQRVLSRRVGYFNEVLGTSGSEQNGIRVHGYVNQGRYDPSVATEPATYLYNNSGGAAIFYNYSAFTASTNRDWYVSYHPGTVLAYYITQKEPDILPAIEAGLVSATVASVYQGMTLVDLASDFNVERSLYKTSGFPAFNRVKYYQQVRDTVILPYSEGGVSGSHLPSATNYTTGSGIKGLRFVYPPGWSTGTVTAMDSTFTASIDLKGAGRGLFVGDTTTRLNSAAFVPGSGDSLYTVTTNLVPSADPEEEPLRAQYSPASSPFAETSKMYHRYDHGGPIAYSFFSAAIRPESEQYKNRLVLQMVGGPLGQTGQFNDIDPSNTDGTAIDAFWPTGRPVLKSKK